MKKAKKVIFLVYVLSVALLISSLSFAATDKATAPTEMQALNAIKPLVLAESQYYDIAKITIQNMTEEKSPSKGRLFYCSASFFMTIKYSRIEELPHIKGLLATTGFKDINDCRKAVKDNSDIQRAAIGRDVITFVESVEDTFGKQFEAVFALALLTDEQCNIEEVYGCEEMNTLFPLEVYFPESVEEMYNNGVKHAKNVIARADTFATNVETLSTLPLYYRVDARDYANRYTSNAAYKTCPCGNSTKMDETKYNPSYHYNCHEDCANFVSQAVFYGGICIDNTWKPVVNNYYWNTVDGLIHYLYTQKGYLMTSNFAECAAGGIITSRLSSSSSRYHVVMCVMNDTVTHQFSGHTRDYRQAVFTSDYPYTAGHTADYYYFRNTTSASQTSAGSGSIGNETS